jgi:hypothetical protein
LFCQHGAAVSLLNLEQGHVIGSFSSTESALDESREDIVTALVASPDAANDFVITSHKSGLLRIWNKEGNAYYILLTLTYFNVLCV